MKILLLFAVIFVSCFLGGSAVLSANEKNEASMIFKSGTNLNVFLSNLKKNKSSKDQIYAMSKFTEPLSKGAKGLKITDKYAINNFIVYGTPSTYNLSAKARYDLVSQYKVKYKKLPISEMDWISVLSLINIKNSSDNSSSSNLSLDIRTTKNTYTTAESLIGSKYYLKYNGKNFRGLILYGEGRDGLIKTSYSATRGDIKTGDFDNPDTMGVMRVSMYSINELGKPNNFECDGIYKYTMAVYDCNAVDKAMGTSDCGNGGWPPTIESAQIFSKTTPLQVKTKNITVTCANGANNCCNNWAYQCSKDKDCLSNYSCKSGKCVKI